MKNFELPVFLTSLLLFVFAALSPSGGAAQMPFWCPGGSTLLCGTETTRTCTAVDPRTAQCSAWKEQVLYYYYYGPNGEGSGGSGGCDPMICQT